jgi:nucleoside-diphosphate-sugar epimerase
VCWSKKQLGDNIDIFEKNLIIINNFIRAVLSVSPKKIIFFSSASVYGEDVFHSNKINENTLVAFKVNNTMRLNDE